MTEILICSPCADDGLMSTLGRQFERGGKVTAVQDTDQAFIKDWRQFHNISQTDLAKRVGVTKGEISRLESGSRRLTMRWLNRIAEALQLRPEQLMTPPPTYRTVAERANDYQRRNPGLSFNIGPLPTSEIIEVEGDEMVTTLNPGDGVVIDKTRTVPAPSGVFAIRHHGTTIIRRLQSTMNQNEIQVSCDNKMYSPFTVPADSLEIVGRVVTHLRRM